MFSFSSSFFTDHYEKSIIVFTCLDLAHCTHVLHGHKWHTQSNRLVHAHTQAYIHMIYNTCGQIISNIMIVCVTAAPLFLYACSFFHARVAYTLDFHKQNMFMLFAIDNWSLSSEINDEYSWIIWEKSWDFKFFIDLVEVNKLWNINICICVKSGQDEWILIFFI